MLWFQLRKIGNQVIADYCSPEDKRDLISVALRDLQKVQRMIITMSERAHVELGPLDANFSILLRAYIGMCSINCLYEISSTCRYGRPLEAAIIARARIKRSEPIVQGLLFPISEEEEYKLKEDEKYFSILQSALTKKLFIVMGPARLVNHDCDPNARFAPSGENSLDVIAIREIPMGSEITVDYGRSYFAEGECRCKSHLPDPSAEAALVLNSDSLKDFPRSRRRLHRVSRDKVLRVFSEDGSEDPVSCDTCQELFWDDSMRATCPPCVRHIFIYGAPWPERMAPRPKDQLI